MNHVWLSIALSGRMKECAQALARPSALIRVWFDLKERSAARVYDIYIPLLLFLFL